MKIIFLGNFGVDYSSENHHKRSLESLGHQVVPLQESIVSSDLVLVEAVQADMFVWVHTHGWETPGVISMAGVLDTLKKLKIPSVTYHLDLWFGLQRQKDLDQDPVYRHIEHFFTVDKQMADWFNKETDVKGHYLHAGVFDQECYMAMPVTPRPPQYDRLYDVIFVGSKGYHPEWPYRPRLIKELEFHYGRRFMHVGGDGTRMKTTRGDALNQLYANTKVVVGDSLCIDFKYPEYWSDRVYETLGRGGFMIHPWIKGMDDDFEDGKHLVFYKFGDFDDLFKKIDYYNEHPDEREKIRKAGHEHVKKNHTYKNRWEEIIKEVTNG